MKKQRLFSLFAALCLFCFAIPAFAQDSAYLILWNIAAKSGQVLPMTLEAEGLFTLTVPVEQGAYTYRIGVGEQKRPIYGLEGKENGKPVPLNVPDNRLVTFAFHAETHLVDVTLSEGFKPARRVVLVGNLQDDLGNAGGQFGGAWDPTADTTRMKMISENFYQFTGHLPAGRYEYKVAIGGSWAENYGQDGKQDGANIVLDLPQEQDVTFYYNDVSHKIADSTWYEQLPNDQLPRIVGDLQTELGADLLLTDQDFSHVYSLALTVPAGKHSFRIAAGKEQTAYGKEGKQGGEPLEFSVNEPKEVFIVFDLNTKQTVVDDGSIQEALLFHDTFDLAYRAPFEAVKTGETVTLRFHAGAGEVTAAQLIIGKADIQGNQVRYGVADNAVEMTLKEAKTINNANADVWEATVALDAPGLYGYKFRLNGAKEFGDDTKAGGTGKAGISGVAYFPLTVYDAAFTTPNWIKEAIIYQIFPDRFFNGKPANDSAKTTARGAEPLASRAWDQQPGIPGLNDSDEFFNNDFFGGDLEGIRQKLDYLQSLGVTVLYLNPIFAAASNHKYDATNYDEVDPLFGTMEDFTALTKELQARGMHLMLDGVFNHVGDDSIYFDRYGKYEWVGAYEYWSRVYDKMNSAALRLKDAQKLAEQELTAEGQKFSPYEWQNWFTMTNVKENGLYRYEGWAGYDSLPVVRDLSPQEAPNAVVNRKSELNNRLWADYILFDENSVAKRWIKAGSSGWRMDVATEVEPGFWQAFRKEIKQMTLPSGEQPVLLAETWQDASLFFLGDQFDSVMNYGFRHAVLNQFLMNGDAAAADATFRTMRQNYPKEAYYSLMNLIGSHDTARAIYLLGGGKEERLIAEKGKDFDYELGKQRLKIAAIFQMGYPGAPTIYYGDEAGLYGAQDPDCRRPYPWGSEDQEILAHYRKVAEIRAAHKDLFAHGDLLTLYAEGDVYAYARIFEKQVAIIAINRGNAEKEMTLTLSVPVENRVFSDQLDPAYSATVSGQTLTINLPAMTGRMLIGAAQ
ncbi:amylopullulanase [Candidatus Moduliflexus flocculans]|uniref:Amylopullulanase n=1 Tax=Candidatus Moduliflexus flocculans TaxID=1499966 RepID=A0A0S6VQ68_9BACT|nr:amylopullulanase [Candidatus Moduliflexus flocculans]